MRFSKKVSPPHQKSSNRVVRATTEAESSARIQVAASRTLADEEMSGTSDKRMLNHKQVAFYFEALERAGGDLSAIESAKLRDALERYRKEATSIFREDAEVSRRKMRVLELLPGDTSLASGDTSPGAAAETKRYASFPFSQSPSDNSVSRLGLARPPSRKNYNEAQEVIPGLLVSGFHPLLDVKALLERRITHVFSCIGASVDMAGTKLTVLSISMEDHAQENIERYFPTACTFIDSAIKGKRGEEGRAADAGASDTRRPGAVLVHCGAGISRAPTICAAYIIWRLGVSAEEAIDLVRAARPYAFPNRGFVEQLKRWYGRCGGQICPSLSRLELSDNELEEDFRP